MRLIEAERLIHTFQEEVCEATKVYCCECPFWRSRGGECLIENHIRIEAEKMFAEESLKWLKERLDWQHSEGITNGWIDYKGENNG